MTTRSNDHDSYGNGDNINGKGDNGTYDNCNGDNGNDMIVTHSAMLLLLLLGVTRPLGLREKNLLVMLQKLQR